MHEILNASQLVINWLT